MELITSNKRSYSFVKTFTVGMLSLLEDDSCSSSWISLRFSSESSRSDSSLKFQLEDC